MYAIKGYRLMLLANCFVLHVFGLSGISLKNDKIVEMCKLMAQPSSSLIIVSDHQTGCDTTGITDGLSRQGIIFIVIDVRHFIYFLEEKIKQELTKNDFSNIRSIFNIIIYCTSDVNMTALFQEIETLDAERGLGYVIRHFSSWLCICEDETNLPPLTLTTDNVAVFVSRKDVKVLTLVWGPDGREWRAVSCDDGREWRTVSCEGINTGLDNIFPNSKLGLNGRRLQAAALSWPPYLIYRSVNGSEHLEGMSITIMDYFAEKLNFTYATVSPQDKQWGTPDEKGKWNGVIGMLQRNAADISLAPYSNTRERSEVMSFTYPSEYQKIRVTYKKLPVDPDRKWTLLTSIFRWQVYAWGVVTLAFIVLMLALFERWNFRREQDVWLKRLPDVLYLAIIVPLRQGATAFPHSRPSKILLCFWWLFCLILTAVYVGNLTAVLTVEREKVPFSTLEELAANDDYEVGLGEGSFMEFALKVKMARDCSLRGVHDLSACKIPYTSSSNKSVFVDLWQKVQRTKTNITFGVLAWRKQQRNRFWKGGFALLSEANGIKNTLGDCGWTQMDGYILPTYSSFTFPLHSPLACLFYSDLQMMTETGLMSVLHRNWTTKETCNASQKTTALLRTEDLLAATVGCAGCVLIASVTLLVEIVISKIY